MCAGDLILSSCLSYQVKYLGSGLVANVEQVPEAPGDQEGHPLSFPLQQGISSNSGSHAYPLDHGGVQQLIARNSHSQKLKNGGKKYTVETVL